MVRWSSSIALLLTVSPIAASSSTTQDLTESDYLAEPQVVLTASRMVQSVMDAPNAVTVIDRETIAGSGYTRVVDLFRLVPGMFVGEKSGWYTVVSHSFIDEWARRMQVMIDGRSVYLPTFGGVRWDTLPLAVDDIERIEVVRGPNAASYGANSVTGSINIITRHPADVPGRKLEIIGGDHGQREAWFRWGGGGDQVQHRITLGRREDGGLKYAQDDERSNILDYRGDIRVDARQSLSLQVGVVEGTRGDGAVGRDQKVDSHSLQVDYSLQLDKDHDLLVKAFGTGLSTQGSGPASLPEQNVTGDRQHIEVQFNNQHAQGLRSTVGAYLREDTVRSQYWFNTGNDLKVGSGGVFGHLEWRLSPHWLLNAGVFHERYSLVNDKTSPHLALNWQPSQDHSFRLSMSSAYRNPVVFEEKGDVAQSVTLPRPIGPVTIHAITGNQDIVPEYFVSREIGYLGRWPSLHVSLDLRLFDEHLDNYIGLTANQLVVSGIPISLGGFPVKIWTFGNWGGVDQTGCEAQFKWQPLAHTQVIANYAEFHMDSHVTSGDIVQRTAPSHMEGLHMMHRLPGQVDVNVSQYWVASFCPIGDSCGTPAYRRLDVGLRKHFKLGDFPAAAGLQYLNLHGNYYGFYQHSEGIVDQRAVLDFRLEF